MPTVAASPRPSNARKAVFIGGVLLMLVLVVALISGQSKVAISALWSSQATGAGVLWDIRLPRVLGAALLGAALAVAGLASQVVLRNPLASPDVLGVSAGAALGASFALVLGWGTWALTGAAFAAGLAVTMVVASVSVASAQRAVRDPVLVALLVGMAISSFCAAGLTAVKWWADPAGKLPTLTFWLLGSMAAFGWRELFVLLSAVVPAFALLWWQRDRVGVLALGDEVAKSVGAPVMTLRWSTLCAVALIAAAGTAVSGLIPWVALLVPHAARLLLGGQVARPWLLSAIVGAMALVAVDTLCRSVSALELPPGVVLALVGVPGFLWLIGRREVR